MTAIVSDYANGGRLEDVGKMLNRIADRETPLLNRHLNLGMAVQDIKHEWVDKRLKGLRETLSASCTSTETILTLSGGTDAPKRIIDGVTLMLIDSELVLVTSTITTVTNSSRHVVTRGSRSTTNAVHAANAEVRLMNVRDEGFTAGRDDSQKGTRKYNYTTIIERQAKLSGSSQGANSVQNEMKLKSQMAELVPELMKELEQQLIYGVRYADADEDTRGAGGFHWWATSGGGNAEDMSAAAISEAVFEDVIENYIKNGGQPNKLCALASIKQQRGINDLKTSRVVGAHTQKEKNLNNFVEVYEFGSKAHVEIFFSPDVRDDEIYFYQKDKVKVMPLNDRAVKQKPLPEDGDFVRKMVFGEYTFVFENPEDTLFLKHNLKTNYT